MHTWAARFGWSIRRALAMVLFGIRGYEWNGTAVYDCL
jgi:hypothetical protein